MPDPAIIAGYPGIEEMPVLPNYDRRTGFSAVRRYKGPVDQMRQFIAVLAQAASAVRMVERSGVYITIEATYDNAQDGAAPPTELLEVKWDRLGNDLEKDIFTHPDYKTLALDDAQALRDYRDGKLKDNQWPWNSSQVLNDFYNLIHLKVQSYSVSAFVMRKTAVITADTDFTESLAAVGKVYSTTAAFITGEDVPEVPFTIPDGEWLIRTPTVTAQGKQRWQYTHEFWWAVTWNSRLYTHL